MPLEIAQALAATRLADLRAQLEPLLKTPLPLTLEIGSGHGHYLTGYAEAHPERFCIGIDIIGDRLDRSFRKSNRAGLKNIAWIHAEARLFLEALPAETRLAEIFILFSDPWPKRRHWKNRVIQTEFLSELAAKAGEGARLCFRTDHAPYFSYAHEIISTHPDWAISPPALEAWPFELVSVFQSRADAHQSLIARRRPHNSPPASTAASASAASTPPHASSTSPAAINP